MLIHLIRHGHAGRRRDWAGPDEQRPLSERGEAQARALDEALAGAGIGLLWSSNFQRCIQTLEPLATRLDLPVESTTLLTEGACGGPALDALLGAVADGHAVAASSHGDVIPAILREAQDRGASLDGPSAPRKAARYQLTVVDGRIDHIVHIDAPQAPA